MYEIEHCSGSSKPINWSADSFQVVMKTGSLTSFSTPHQRELIGKMTENANNKIPHYARDYKK